MKTRNLLWQIPLLIFVTGPLWWDFAADLLDPQKDHKYRAVRAEKSFIMDGVTLVQSKDGNKEFLLNAERVSSENGQKVLLFENVKALIFDDPQKFDISGNEAVFDTEKQIITLLDDVEINSNDGYSLKTPALRYFVKYKKMKSAAPLDFTGDRLSISGNSFSFDMESGNFRVGSRVHFRLW